jgi:long-chain acyl-CoA synthetase
VALISENRPEWTVAYFAVTAAGATAVPLDVQLRDAEVANVVTHAGCQLAVASGRQAPRLLALDAGGATPLRVVDLDAGASNGRTLSFRAILQSVDDRPAPPLPAVAEDAWRRFSTRRGPPARPRG